MIPIIRSDVSYDSGQSPCKRSRVGDHMQDPTLLHHAATSPPQLVVEAPYSNPDFADHCNLIAENTIVCFGMLVDCPVIAASKTTILPASAGDSVIFTAEKFLQHTPTGVLLGNVDDQTSEILSRLKADPDLAYQLTLRRDALAAATNSRLVKGILGYLSVIIYGPMHRFDDVGDFVTQCGRFLEDPVGCNRDVLYMNPQCLFSTHETPVTTFSLSINLQYLVEDIAQSCFDTLAGFETRDPLTETPTPVCLLTDLQSHQKQALTFFMRREQGLHPIEDSVGLWARQLDGRGFTNIITNQTQLEPGPLWRGGLLADEMGLGKTLSMIALIASDHTNDNRQPSQTERTPAREPCSTLVILPLNIISVWVSQLESHVRPGELTHFIHHGKNKLRLADGASPPDIVFTTYQTVEREQQKGSSSFNSLRAHFWRRIVLDEAHIIRNHRTSTAQAIAALKAKCRWAISGTPVQNKLTDFLGLFKFLHFAPYNDPRIFDEELQQLWRERPADEAAKTFKKLLSCFMLRRTKAILDLPTRTDKILFVPFSEQEKDYYLRVETPVIELLDQSSGDSLPNAIQQINGLRLICNLGTHAPQRYNQDNPVLVDGSLTAMLGARLSMGEDMCTQCLGSVSLPSTDDELGTATSSDTYYSACGLIYCAACTQLLRFRSSGLCRCTNDATSCPLIPLSSSIRTPRLTSVRGISPSFRYDSDDIKVSSKVCALIEQIKSTPTEKSAVFSFWTTSLDMVERGLSSENIRSVRIDGNVAAKNRVHAIEQLRHNPKVRVILLTISCGACGLDLTAASVIHLLEPQWNPSLEDQAFARAHRLGQTRPVTMIKYIMQDSFEEHILKVQDRKKLLANTLLSDRSAIKELQKLLHEKRDQAGQT